MLESHFSMLVSYQKGISARHVLRNPSFSVISTTYWLLSKSQTTGGEKIFGLVSLVKMGDGWTYSPVSPAQVNWVVQYQGFVFCWFHILRKMLETCVAMNFPDLKRQMEWCQSYFTKISLKSCKQKIGALYYLGYLMCSKFCASYYLKISMWF